MIVLHTAEGARTYQSLGMFFKGNVEASSHVGIDDTPGTIGEYVRRSDKAWTCAAYNSMSVNAEICAFAAWDTAEWNRHPVMLENVARWIAEEATFFGIPITKLTASQAQGGGRGVCQHSDLGTAGGGHHDCGPGFPIDHVLEMARGGWAPAPTPPKEEDIVAIACGQSKDGVFHVVVEAKDGSVWETWQKPGESAWSGGKEGVSKAKLTPLAPAPK